MAQQPVLTGCDRRQERGFARVEAARFRVQHLVRGVPAGLSDDAHIAIRTIPARVPAADGVAPRVDECADRRPARLVVHRERFRCCEDPRGDDACGHEQQQGVHALASDRGVSGCPTSRSYVVFLFRPEFHARIPRPDPSNRRFGADASRSIACGPARSALNMGDPCVVLSFVQHADSSSHDPYTGITAEFGCSFVAVSWCDRTLHRMRLGSSLVRRAGES